MTESSRIYLSPPHMSQESLDHVREAFESNWIAPLGPQVEAFEKEFSRSVGVSSATALSAGTAALHLSLVLLGVKAGDEVLCSSFTFAASAFAITYVGGVPVFVDSNTNDWNMDPVLLKELLSQKAKAGRLPRAAIVVDLYGQPADYDQILPVCAEYGVAVIEDAAEALGAMYKGRPVGSFGNCGVFSFNGNKIITTSGGGMLVSNDPELAERGRFLASQARDPAPHYQHSEIGYNYRMSNVLAAIGRGQLRHLSDRVEARRRIFREYVKRLGHLPGVEFMPEPEYARSTRWLTCLTIDPDQFGSSREDVRLALEAENIESRPLWKPMHMQPVFSECRVVGGDVSAALFERGLCLPSGSALTDEQIDRISWIVAAQAT